MPQLATGPWFFIFFALWVILISISPKKIFSHLNLYDPDPKTLKTSYNPWTWPWQ